MKNQGGESKAAPRPTTASKASSGLVLGEGDSPEAAAPPEGGETPGLCGQQRGAGRAGVEPGKSRGVASSVGGWAAASSSLHLWKSSGDLRGRKSRFLPVSVRVPF